jgi:Flp pilus assembly protein TadG
MTRTCQPNRVRKSRGIAAAELAVCLPIIVLMVIATIESCSAMFLKQSLTISAYEGVRAAIAKGSSPTSIQAACNQVLADRRVQGSQITITPNTGTATMNPGDYIQITVTAPCAPNCPVPTTFFRNRTLTASASMMVED